MGSLSRQEAPQPEDVSLSLLVLLAGVSFHIYSYPSLWRPNIYRTRMGLQTHGTKSYIHLWRRPAEVYKLIATKGPQRSMELLISTVLLLSSPSLSFTFLHIL